MNTRTSDRADHEPPRRSFLWSLGAVVVGTVISLAGLASGLVVFLDPLLRKRRIPRAYQTGSQAGEGYYRVAPLSAVPEDGLPRRFPVVAARVDAWNFVPNQPIGSVYLRREPGKELIVLQSTCPHAGCSVSAVTTPEGAAFHCPCHNSSFDLSGARMARPGKKNPSPRDMDSLAYKIIDGEIWVEYKDFFTGRAEKVAKS